MKQIRTFVDLINLCDRGEQRLALKSAVVVLDGASVFCALVVRLSF